MSDSAKSVVQKMIEDSLGSGGNGSATNASDDELKKMLEDERERRGLTMDNTEAQKILGQKLKSAMQQASKQLDGMASKMEGGELEQVKANLAKMEQIADKMVEGEATEDEVKTVVRLAIGKQLANGNGGGNGAPSNANGNGKAASGELGTGKMETEESEEEATETNEPYGAQAARSLHASLDDLGQMAKAAMGPLENPKMKEAMDSIVTQLENAKMEVEGAYADQYPDMPGLGDSTSDSEVGGSEEISADAVKTWLASSRAAKNALLGAATRIERLAASKTLRLPQIKQQLATIARSLAGMSRQATSSKTQSRDAVEKLTKERDELANTLATREEQLAKLVDQLNRQIPANV